MNTPLKSCETRDGALIRQPSFAVGAYVFGQRSPPLILSFIESWMPYAERIHLMCAELPKGVFEQLSVVYPNVRLHSMVDPDVAGEGISAKGARFRAHLGSVIRQETVDSFVFADIDTIAVRDPRGMCGGDIVLTVRTQGDTRTWFNGGVVALSPAALDSGLLSAWWEEARRISTSPEMMRLATSSNHAYGGPQQFALMRLLDVDPDTNSIGGFGGLHVKTVACADYNACENICDPVRATVVHLKGALQGFLLQRRPLVGERLLADSAFQLDSAITANQAGLRRVCARFPQSVSTYRFRTPWLMRSDYTLPDWFVQGYKASIAIRAAVGRLRRAMLNWCR